MLPLFLGLHPSQAEFGEGVHVYQFGDHPRVHPSVPELHRREHRVPGGACSSDGQTARRTL